MMDAPLVFARIHPSAHAPVFFSPGLGQPPLGRFDSLSGLFGVLYMAFKPEGALAETLLRNPARRTIGLTEVAARSLSLLMPSRAIRLVRMNGPGLQRLGLDNAITIGPYDPCGRSADALFAHPDRPDGIAYASRHDPDQIYGKGLDA